MRGLALFFATALASVVHAAAPLAAQPAEQISRPEISQPDFGLKGQTAFPNMARLAHGAILCAFAFKPQKNWDAIYVTRTGDAGRSWSPAVKVMDRPAEGY